MTTALLLLQEPPNARDGASRPDPGYEMRDPPLGLLPDLGSGGAVVSLRIHRVVVLIRLERAGNVAREPVGDLVIGLGMLRRHRARADHDLGAVRAEQIALLLALLVRHGADEPVSLDRRGHREADPGVPARWLDDRSALAQEAAPLGVLDHEQADTVLDRAPRVQVLELRDDGRPDTLRDAGQAHERRLADQTKYVGCDGHMNRMVVGVVLRDSDDPTCRAARGRGLSDGLGRAPGHRDLEQVPVRMGVRTAGRRGPSTGPSRARRK